MLRFQWFLQSAQVAGTNPLECRNQEIGCRSEAVGIFPNDRAVIRLVGVLMLEQNDEWASDQGVRG